MSGFGGGEQDQTPAMSRLHHPDHRHKYPAAPEPLRPIPLDSSGEDDERSQLLLQIDEPDGSPLTDLPLPPLPTVTADLNEAEEYEDCEDARVQELPHAARALYQAAAAHYQSRNRSSYQLQRAHLYHQLIRSGDVYWMKPDHPLAVTAVKNQHVLQNTFGADMAPYRYGLLPWMVALHVPLVDYLVQFYWSLYEQEQARAQCVPPLLFYTT